MNAKEAFRYFKLLEQQYWKSLSQQTLQYLTYDGELRPEDMLLYGEFGFALLNLKPNVLIDFRDAKENANFFASVVSPVLDVCVEKTLGYHTILNHKSYEKSLDGCILIYSINKPIKQVDLLLVDGNNQFIEEGTLATILNYPGRLPSNDKEISTMKSVIYFHDSPKGLIALTSFAIQNSEEKYTIDHFKSYSTACNEKFDVKLKLLIQ